MTATAKAYRGLLRDVLKTFSLDRRDLEVKRARLPATAFEEEARLEGEMSAYDHFLGMVPKLALEYGVPPYLLCLSTVPGGRKKYHQGKSRKAVTEIYASYLAALVEECKRQGAIAAGRSRTHEIYLDTPKREAALWLGASFRYLKILSHIYKAAFVRWRVPISCFLTQAQIDNGDPLPFIHMI